MLHPVGAPMWFWAPSVGGIGGMRWSTLITWLVITSVVTVATRNPLKGAAVAMAWLCGYEIVYEATGSVIHRWSLQTLFWTSAGTAGWPLACWAWGMRPAWRVLAIMGALWVVWIALGFNSNWRDFPLGQPGADVAWSWSDEALNVGTKTLLAVALVLGALRLRSAAETASPLPLGRSALRRAQSEPLPSTPS